MIVAFFIECACPPDRRAAAVGGGEFSSPEEFLASYHLTHIECLSCGEYYRLIGYIDAAGDEHRVELLTDSREVVRRRIKDRMVSSRSVRA